MSVKLCSNRLLSLAKQPVTRLWYHLESSFCLLSLPVLNQHVQLWLFLPHYTVPVIICSRKELSIVAKLSQQFRTTWSCWLDVIRSNIWHSQNKQKTIVKAIYSILAVGSPWACQPWYPVSFETSNSKDSWTNELEQTQGGHYIAKTTYKYYFSLSRLLTGWIPAYNTNNMLPSKSNSDFVF